MAKFGRQTIKERASHAPSRNMTQKLHDKIFGKKVSKKNQFNKKSNS